MSVEVLTATLVARPRAEVAAFAARAENAPAWYVHIESVQWKSEPVLRVGARVAFVARLLGRRLAYTYEIVEFREGVCLVMRTAEGPF